ncbi:hypothetical protein KHS38_04585 [Mucilaginibacter sp. Bleaf8]|uniref:hypothetical protein n=1 Tax=Mucilaginibacter sp. Bleaf8 TaxID=2834430 RepID=UPI001BD0BF0D|nr:hypothetical protein [Mucilaginibacter sp. Bleaf8]MBS7563674.1 hypothetical protein [Mucilaginibacter sp. Bleaf8]
MKSKILNSLALTFCGAMICLFTLDITGKWIGFVDYNGNAIDLAYNFKADGDKLTGTSETPYGQSTIADGKIDKDNISFNIQLNGTSIPHTGKIYQDSIVLKMNYQGTEMQTTLKRAKK